MIFLLFLVFGAIVGSFLNVVILRLPRGESLGGRSYCPHCRHKLHSADLVPIASYLALHGKCAYCNKKISPRYAIIESLAALLFGLTYLLLPHFSAADWMYIARALFIVSVLIAVFAIDYEHFLILDHLIVPASFVLLFLNFALDVVRGSSIGNSYTIFGLLAAVGLFLFFWIIYALSKGKWMGFGDVKFAVFLGLATPYPFIIVNIFMAFMIGAIVGIGLILFRGRKLKTELPFGTFLSLSTLIVIFFGPELINWYLKILGFWYLAHY